MNEILIEKIVFICFKEKLKYDDDNLKLIEMKNYLLYIHKLVPDKLNIKLNYILSLANNKDNLLIPASIYIIIRKEFPKESLNYWQKKVAEDFLKQK